MGGRKHIWQCRGAQVLMIIAIVFWLWFGIGSAMAERGGWFDWFMHILMPAGIFTLSAGVGLRWERVGGILFMLEGVVATGLLIQPHLAGRLESSTLLLMLFTLSLPPLVAGIFLLICSDRRRHSHTSESSQSR